MNSSKPYDGFECYDVLQIERDGVWLDYMTLRCEEDGHEAVLYVQGKHRAAPKGFKFRITGFLAGEGWCVKLGAT